MGWVRRGIWYLILIVCALATAALVFKGHLPKPLFDRGAWAIWWNNDPLNALELFFTAAMSVVAAIGSLMQLFGAQPVDAEQLKAALKPLEEQLKQLSASFMASLASQRLPNAPPLDPQIEAAQTAIVYSILASADPLDVKARDAIARTDVAGTISAILEAAKADRAQAARHYRNAGMLAYSQNVSEAIAAFKQSLELNPHDFWVWILLSRLQRVGGTLPDAVCAARRAIDLATSSRERAIALEEQGKALFDKSELSEARNSFQEGLRLFEGLRGTDPQSLRDIGLASLCLGQVLFREQNFAAALEHFELSHRQWVELAQQSPNDIEVQRDLCVSLDHIGRTRLKLGISGVLDIFAEILTITQALHNELPSDTRTTRDLSVCHENLGDYYSSTDEFQLALGHYEASRALRSGLVKADPTNNVWKRDLSSIWQRCGNTLLNMGKTKDAAGAYEQCLALAMQLAQLDPTNTRWETELGVANFLLAQAIEKADLARAISLYRIACPILERALIRTPKDMKLAQAALLSRVKGGA